MQSFSRRTFLKGVAATTCGSCVHAISPLSNGGFIAWGAPEPAQFGVLGANPLLILLNLDGGCSYNITPIYTGAFRDRNPNISYGPENSIPLTSNQGLHPSLVGLKSIWDENNLAVLNLVGLNDPSGVTRSHDEGANIKLKCITNVAEVKANLTPGWVENLSAHFGEPFSGITINSSRSSLMGGSNPPLSITGLDNLGETAFIRPEVGDWTKWTRSAILDAGIRDPAQIPPNQATVRNTMAKVDRDFAELGRQIAPVTLQVPFDLTQDASGFIRACRDAARLAITSSLKVRFIYLEHRGFDTHGEEGETLKGLLNTLNKGLTPLIQTLKASGRWGETVIATLTEFGRTHRNGTNGSDHGHATSMLVMGGRVKGRQVNPVPSVTQINRGDYFNDVDIDFRHVFYEIITAMGLAPDGNGNQRPIFPYRVAPRPQPLNLF
jgi:uncharacterized protein (DUF1501 family)